jgi:hypothetical protein
MTNAKRSAVAGRRTKNGGVRNGAGNAAAISQQILSAGGGGGANGADSGAAGGGGSKVGGGQQNNASTSYGFFINLSIFFIFSSCLLAICTLSSRPIAIFLLLLCKHTHIYSPTNFICLHFSVSTTTTTTTEMFVDYESASESETELLMNTKNSSKVDGCCSNRACHHCFSLSKHNLLHR